MPVIGYPLLLRYRVDGARDPQGRDVLGVDDEVGMARGGGTPRRVLSLCTQQIPIHVIE